MSASDNVQAVRDIYSAFAQGQIPLIVEHLSDDIVWIQPGATDLPWGGTARGKSEVARFFRNLDGAVDVERFEPRRFFADGEDVVVLGYWSGSAKARGQSFDGDWAMTWSFKGGKIARYQAFLDSSALAKLF
jgi:uncharacterized protein